MKQREVTMTLKLMTNAPTDALIDKAELGRVFWEDFKDGAYRTSVLDVEVSEPVK